MTQPDPFAAAAAAAGANTTVADTDGNLATAFSSEESQLFSGPILPPSLLNKTHLLGSERHGIITKAPYDVHARDFNTKTPKYFLKTPIMVDGKSRKVGNVPIDPTSGKPNDPVKDTVVELKTDYRFDAAESAAVNRDVNATDDGARAFYASGDDLKLLRQEIGRLGIRSSAEMVGMTFTVKRVGQKPNPGGNPSWVNEIKLSR